MEFVPTAPEARDFVLLSEYDARTPETFFNIQPVLHLHAPVATLRVPHEHAAAQDMAREAHLLRLTGGVLPQADQDEMITIPEIDVWVSSRRLTLFSQPRGAGLAVPYPNISITALNAHEVLLELNLSDADTADEDIESIQIRIIPGTAHGYGLAPIALDDGTDVLANGLNGTTNHDTSVPGGANGIASDHGPIPGADDPETDGVSAPVTTTTANNASATALYQAISDCQELNPTSTSDDDDDDDDGQAHFLDPTAPGATGWITSENMADFLDADGNLRMPNGVVEGVEELELDGEDEDEPAASSLGPGAGRTRTAAEVETANGEAPADGEDTKWQRTG